MVDLASRCVEIEQHRCSRTIQQFQDITGCTKKAATDLLRQHNFNLERAIDTFFTLSAEKRRSLVGNAGEPGPSEGPAPIDEKKAAAFFEKYAVQDTSRCPPESVIKEEGLERLSDDLGAGLDDLFFLIFAFHCGCRTQGVIAKADFIRGLRSLHVDTLQSLKAAVQPLREGLFKDVQQLRKVYSYAFTYSLEPLQKQLPTELAVAYWRLILEPLDWSLFNPFLQYIEDVSGLPSITKDVWLMVLEFVLTSQRAPGQAETAEENIDRVLQDYEDDGAWPLVIDNFVEWMRDERKKAQQS
ncbi:hypothetical protein Emed_000288 [Eimeria media]